MGGVKSRNGRTHCIERDGVASIKENTSDVHERGVFYTNFLASADCGEDRYAVPYRELQDHRRVRCRHVESDRKGGHFFTMQDDLNIIRKFCAVG